MTKSHYFQPGNQLGKIGRPPGSLNKRSRQFLEILEKNNFDPAAALMECYNQAQESFKKLDADHKNASDFLSIAMQAAKELAQYAYPKLKSIDHQSQNVMEDLTPQQKLEALKEATKLLELQIKQNGPRV